MSQVVVIVGHETTFTATCDRCGTTFAGRLDPDLEAGVFLCRSGHPIRIERAPSADVPAAEVSAA
ncbi:MAG TPA: hypothetical protein VFL60_04745 [Gaiellaceae bacterium]|nr:hypothetical protein [Gaiellaceae bacterium]